MMGNVMGDGLDPFHTLSPPRQPGGIVKTHSLTHTHTHEQD